VDPVSASEMSNSIRTLPLKFLCPTDQGQSLHNPSFWKSHEIPGPGRAALRGEGGFCADRLNEPLAEHSFLSESEMGPLSENTESVRVEC